MKNRIFILFVLLLNTAVLLADEPWYKRYEQGLELLNVGAYEEAVLVFQNVLQEKPEDTDKIRTYGLHFIQYFPNRELGIAFYYLGNMEKAQFYLTRSMQQEPSERAKNFLQKISSNSKNLARSEKSVRSSPQKNQLRSSAAVAPNAAGAAIMGAAAGINVTRNSEKKAIELKKAKEMVGKKSVKIVGEQMAVAIFPFQVTGNRQDLGEVIQDKLITALFHQKRFRVIERSQLERILEEQKLGMSGLLDASTAAELGKGIGVDAIIIGSANKAPNGAIGIDARAIDTESATIIVANDAYAANSDARNLKTAVENLAFKFVQSLPLIEGYIINVGNRIMIDKGLLSGLRKGQKCTVYAEGKEVKHPITGEILGKETQIKGEILVTETYDKYSYCVIVKQEPGMLITVGDKFVTK